MKKDLALKADRWKILSLSICSLRKIYKKEKIKVVCYTEPPEFFKKNINTLNLEIVQLEIKNEKIFKKFNSKELPLFEVNKHLLLKICDFISLAKDDEKVAVLDCDIFFINKFNEDKIDFEKINLAEFKPTGCLNSGLIIANAKSESFSILQKSLQKEIEVICNEKFNQQKYIEINFGKEWLDWRLKSLNIKAKEIKTNHLFFQEEILLNSIKNKNEKIFNDMGLENNGYLWKSKKINFRNIHMINHSPKQIEEILNSLNYFNKKEKNKNSNKYENEINLIKKILKKKICF